MNMEWNEIFRILIVIGGGSVTISLFLLGLRVFFADADEYELNRERSGSLLSPFLGRVKTKFDGSRDNRTRAGLAINKDNQWVEQGALSEEAIDLVLKK